MPLKIMARGILLYMFMIASGCYNPPYNNFKPYTSLPKDAATGAGVGAVIGALSTNTGAGAILGGALIGGAVGASISLYKESKPHLIKELNDEQIQYVEYGNTRTLVVPVDKYYIFNSSELNDICYKGLVNAVKLIKLSPHSIIYVAGFTDNVGAPKRKKEMSQAQAEAMVTFLWANGIAAQRLNAEGYADMHPISQNILIHGSAQNRRVEIQWVNPFPPKPIASAAVTK